jgi:hypothetical protein
MGAVPDNYDYRDKQIYEASSKNFLEHTLPYLQHRAAVKQVRSMGPYTIVNLTPSNIGDL